MQCAVFSIPNKPTALLCSSSVFNSGNKFSRVAGGIFHFWRRLLLPGTKDVCLFVDWEPFLSRMYGQPLAVSWSYYPAKLACWLICYSPCATNLHFGFYLKQKTGHTGGVGGFNLSCDAHSFTWQEIYWRVLMNVVNAVRWAYITQWKFVCLDIPVILFRLYCFY